MVHGEFFTHLMYGSSGIVTFQFHQTSVDEIILSIVPGPGNAAARDEAVAFATGIKRQDATPGRSWDGWFVRILDEHGKEIDSVPMDAVPD